MGFCFCPQKESHTYIRIESHTYIRMTKRPEHHFSIICDMATQDRERLRDTFALFEKDKAGEISSEELAKQSGRGQKREHRLWRVLGDGFKTGQGGKRKKSRDLLLNLTTEEPFYQSVNHKNEEGECFL